MITWRIWYWHGMTKWGWNERDFRIKGFALLRKNPSFHPHSVIPTSFLNDEAARNDVRMKSLHCNVSLLVILNILKWHRMTKWGGMRVFFEEQKNMDSKIPVILLSFCPFLSHLANLVLFKHWKVCNNHRMTSEWAGMSSEWMNQVLSLIKRPHLIHSFRSHSVHS